VKRGSPRGYGKGEELVDATGGGEHYEKGTLKEETTKGLPKNRKAKAPKIVQNVGVSYEKRRGNPGKEV